MCVKGYLEIVTARVLIQTLFLAPNIQHTIDCVKHLDNSLSTPLSLSLSETYTYTPTHTHKSWHDTEKNITNGQDSLCVCECVCVCVLVTKIRFVSIPGQ